MEDNSRVRHVNRTMVANAADEIRDCADGAERPDVVLTDIEMKTMDGITAPRHIMATDPSARVIIVTDYDQPDLREAAHEAGACGYVVKTTCLNSSKD